MRLLSPRPTSDSHVRSSRVNIVLVWSTNSKAPVSACCYRPNDVPMDLATSGPLLQVAILCASGLNDENHLRAQAVCVEAIPGSSLEHFVDVRTREVGPIVWCALMLALCHASQRSIVPEVYACCA